MSKGHPITLVRVEPHGTHYTLHVWVNGAKAGELVVRSDEADALLRLLLPVPARLSFDDLGHYYELRAVSDTDELEPEASA
jgi:hypothetical protein